MTYSRGEDGHIHIRTRGVSTAWRVRDYKYACTSGGCGWWTYDERKASRHELRKSHEVRRYET